MIARPNPDRYERATLTIDDALWSLLRDTGRRVAGVGLVNAMCANRATAAIDDHFAWRRHRARGLTLGLRMRRVVVARHDELDMIERLRPGAVEWSQPRRWLDALATLALHWWGKPAVCVDDGEIVEIMSPDDYDRAAWAAETLQRQGFTGRDKKVTWVRKKSARRVETATE